MNKGKILVLAVFLRILVSMFLFHPDIKTFNFQASFLKKGVVDIYPYLIQNKKTLPLKEEFVYFPLTYFVIGGYQAIVSPVLGSGFDTWLADASSNSVVNNPGIFKYLLALKLPYMMLDITIAYLLLAYFKDRKKKEKAFVYWLFNPFTIILIYGFSNLDIYAVFLTTLSFLFIKRKKLFLSSLFLGLAICFKMYPLLLLPFLFLKGKDLREKFLLVVTPLFLLILSIIPFFSTAFVSSALVSGLTTRIFSPSFSVGFGESIIFGLFILSILFFYAWFYDKKINLLNYFVVILLTIFSFSHFHIAWLMWMAPFLSIVVINNEKLLWPVLIFSISAVLIPLFYEDRSMTISLFRVYSTWFDLLPTPFSVLEKIYDPYSFQSMLHSVLAGGGMFISFNLLKNKTLKKT